MLIQQLVSEKARNTEVVTKAVAMIKEAATNGLFQSQVWLDVYSTDQVDALVNMGFEHLGNMMFSWAFATKGLAKELNTNTTELLNSV